MLRFGFIGCGNISRFHADVILGLHHSITGVSARPGSKNIEDFSKRYNVPDLYYDWRKMLNAQKFNALVVAVSWDETENVIQEIINSGIPCLVEKPVALCSRKLEEIISNTEQFHDRVLVGYNRRFYDFIHIIKQALKEKELISVELNFPEQVENLIKQKSPKIAEYILIYMSSHWLDLLISLIGDLEVEWMQKKLNLQSGNIEAYNGILKSKRYKAPVLLQTIFNAPSNTSITFNFHDSIYKLCPIEMLTIYKGMDLVYPTPENPIKRYIPRVERTFYADTAYKPGFLNQMKYFIEACVQRTIPNASGCTLHDTLAVTRVCEEIEQRAAIIDRG